MGIGASTILLLSALWHPERGWDSHFWGGITKPTGFLLSQGSALLPAQVFVSSFPAQVRKFRTLTELIMDAEEHVKNPYKGKKLKVLGRN